MSSPRGLPEPHVPLAPSSQVQPTDAPDSYHQQLADLLADDADDVVSTCFVAPKGAIGQNGSASLPGAKLTGDQGGDEQFVYPAAQSTATEKQDDAEYFTYPGVTSSVSSDEDESGGNISTENYSAGMRSIMGSSGSDGDDDEQANGRDGTSPHLAGELLLNHGSSERESDVEDQSDLPDTTLESTTSLPNMRKMDFWQRQPSLADISLASSSYTSADPAVPARPPEYPSLLRLRSHASSQRPASSQRSPFGTLGGILDLGQAHSGAAASLSPSPPSRSISFTGSFAGQRRSRLFPYGASDLSAQFEADETLIADPTAAQQLKAGKFPLRSESHLVYLRSLTPGLFKWSAMRRSATFFQGQRSSLSSVSAISGQPLPARVGAQTVLAIGDSVVAIGTTAGMTLIFSFSQELRCICGTEASGQEAGSVTSLAFSADSTYLAIGHAKGHCEVFDLSRPTAAARHVPPVSLSEVASGKKEGHLRDSNILHLAFVGTRHTALFTADDKGLAFYHSLGKILGIASNDTLRILGRYPKDPKMAGSAESRRSAEHLPILSLAALPLGPVHHPADSVHFAALVTPRKVVIVGLKPSARTWYRKSAPLAPATPAPALSMTASQAAIEEVRSEVDPPLRPPKDNGLSSLLRRNRAPQGCAAWFPAYRASEPSSCTDEHGMVKPTLAFSFGPQLFLCRILIKRRRVKPEKDSDSASNEAPQYRTDLEFSEQLVCSTNTTSQQIEAIKWLSHEMLLLLMPSSISLFDLRTNTILKAERLAPTLQQLVRRCWPTQPDEDVESHDASAVADGRSSRYSLVDHSIQAYRGKVFFLTSSQVVVGHLLTWTDRLLALVSSGDFLSAIELSTAFYLGQLQDIAIGLPEDCEKVREQVGSKLRELMSSSARYAFSPDRLTDNTHITPDGRGVDRTDMFLELAQACTEACLAQKDTSFLFGPLYDFYADSGIEGIFVEQIEPFVLADRLQKLPIPVTQKLIKVCESAKNYELAEKIIWHVDSSCLDLDQVLSLCSAQRLYDAMIFVYNSALHDYVSPVIELLEPLKQLLSGGELESNDALELQDIKANVYKIFSYLSVALCGRSFPAQVALPEKEAAEAKSALYGFLLSGHCLVWPPEGGGRLILSVKEGQEEHTYPYLRLLLTFDAEALLDALDIAFEDSYLDADESSVPIQIGKQVTRQGIIDILLVILADEDDRSRLSENDGLFVTIFIARNAPKYPQFVKLLPSTVDSLLHSLAYGSGSTMREDRQLAAECLLSASGKATFTDDELAMFEHAGFWRILQSAYRATGKWGQLVAMFLNDASMDPSVFASLSEVMSKAMAPGNAKNTVRGSSDLDSMIIEAVDELITQDVVETVRLMDRFYPDKHAEALDTLDGNEGKQLSYLKVFLEPHAVNGTLATEQAERSFEPIVDPSHLNSSSRELFVSLKSSREPESLVQALSTQAGDYFDLEHVLECARRDGANHVVLWALDRQGQLSYTFEALDAMIFNEGQALRKSEQADDPRTSAHKTAERLRRTMQMAVNICTARCENLGQDQSGPRQDMWFQLLRSLVNLVHTVADPQEGGRTDSAALAATRDIVQETLGAILTSMSAEFVSFPLLFRRLTEEGSGKQEGQETSAPVRYYAEVRTVVDAMIEACKVRVHLHDIAYRLFERDTSANFRDLVRRQKRGWRPSVMLDGIKGSCARQDTMAGAAISKNLSASAPYSVASTPMRRGLSRAIDFLSGHAASSSSSSSPPPPSSSMRSNGRVGQSHTQAAISSPLSTPSFANVKGKSRAVDIDDASQVFVKDGDVSDYFSVHPATVSDVDASGFDGGPADFLGSGATAVDGMARSAVSTPRATWSDVGDGVDDESNEEGTSIQRQPLMVRLGAVY